MSERRRPEPRPRDHTDAAQDIARELADVAGQLTHLKGEAMNWLDDPNYEALRLRLENAHAAVEAATAEVERWLAQISEVRRKRARYQEMAAEGLIEFEELRARLAALEDTRKTAERELRTLEVRTEHLAQLERDRDSLLENYADLLPEAIDALGSEERHRVYRMIGMEAHLAPDESLEVSGDVMNFSKLEISSA